MADSGRSRLATLHTRNISAVSAESDSSDTTPCPTENGDTDYFMAHPNDSESSLGAATAILDCDAEMDIEQVHRLSPISMLPPEILISILMKLGTTADLRNCLLVSYYWALHTVGILWHRPLCNKWQNLLNIVTVLNKGSRAYFPYHEMVKRLNLSGLADKINDGTVQSFVTCKAVERLTLTNCAKLTDFGVSGLIDGCKKLQALDVTDLDSLTDRTLHIVAQNCSKLQGLNITNCHNITDDSLVQVAEQCQQLKRLKLNGVVRVTDASIIAVAKNCRSILEIDLAGCQAITSESVTALLTNLSHLRELRLAHCNKINDTAFTSLPPRIQFDALRILDLTACEQVRDDAIVKIIPAAPRLRNLVLAKCRHITDRAVLAICKLTKNLHYIHLGHCTNLTDTAVIQLVKSCNRIRYIDLACCFQLTDASVRHLAQLPKLRRIGLVKCTNLTDSSIIALAHGPLLFSASGKAGVSSQFVSLERVHLSYCVNLTLKGITALLHNCPRLTHLSLTGVQAFLHEDLTRFCRDAPAEFTHPQRDVFCVFSGEGVQRLREYLMHLATAEEENQGREAIDESLLDGVDSPGADTMSDDGTIDGNEQNVDGVLASNRPVIPTGMPSRPRQRPRSMHEFSYQHLEMPSMPHEHLRRIESYTPDSQAGTDVNTLIDAPAIDLLNLQQPYSHTSGFDHRSRSPGLPPLFDLGLDLDDSNENLTRTASRRHTLQATPGSLFDGPIPRSIQSPDADYNQIMHLGENRLGSNLSMSAPYRSDSQGQSSSPFGTINPRNMMDTRLQYLRPDYEYSAFEAEREAILSTIPGIQPPTYSATRADSLQAGRPGGHGRMGGLLGGFRGQYPGPISPAEAASRTGRTTQQSRELSRQDFEMHREAMLRVLADSEARRQHRGFTTESPNREADSTPLSMITSDDNDITPLTPLERRQDGGDQDGRVDDVTMTQ